MKTLIVYTTKYGSVEQIANILKSKLQGEVALVNLKKEKAPNPDQFDCIILGGSIYIGKIQKAIAEYAQTNLPKLLNKRIGLFICAAEQDPVRSQELENSFPAELFNHALVKEAVGYEISFDKANFMDKFLIRKVKGVKESCAEFSDEAIENIVKALA